MRLIPLIALIAIATACPVTPGPDGSDDRGLAADAGHAPNDGGAANDGGGAASDGGSAPGDDAGTLPTTDTGLLQDAGEQPSHDLIGTWLIDPPGQVESETIALAYREDGRMARLAGLNPCVVRNSVPYRVEGSTLTLYVSGQFMRSTISWDGEALLLDNGDGDVRLTRTADNCHVVPPSVSIVGTWEMTESELDWGPQGAPQAFAFTDTGLMIHLRDQGQCSVMRNSGGLDIHEYYTEGDQLVTGTRAQSGMPYEISGDELTMESHHGVVRARRIVADCHESTDLPPALIGTYSAEPAFPRAVGLVALRADNTMVGISQQEGCVEAYAWRVFTHGQTLLVETESRRFIVLWRQEGSSVILTEDDLDEVTLSRVRTDCHSLP